jgi:hypothetical protein
MDYLFGKSIIASNATLYPYLLDRIEAYFGGK